MDTISNTPPEGAPIGRGDLLKLCAIDGNLFAREFFPRTVRQPSPPMHREVWSALDDPRFRLVNVILPRDFAKTSILRMFTAKRVGYNLSRTILYLSASEDHATRSIRWLKRTIENNQKFTQTFGLRRGSKWQETEIEIFHGIQEQPIWILGMGILGNVRGINFDDYRPDLIVVDDALTDENAATLEQREKMTNLILGAIKESLAPRSEAPNAKLAMLNTPQNINDFAMEAANDTQFHTIIRGCWTEESKDLPLEEQVSAWPERHPTETLREEKRAAIKRNRLSVFLREKECRLTSPETATFRAGWLQSYDKPPSGMMTVVAVDPVPPPSDRQIERALKGKDFEAVVVWGRKGPDYFLLDYRLSRGHQPNWTVSTVFEMVIRWRCMKAVVEQVGYQTVLKGLLETEMARRQLFFPVLPVEGQSRAKFIRISNAFAGIGSSGHLFVKPTHSEFIEQFTIYGPLYRGHDDLLDASASAVHSIMNPYLELEEDEFFENDSVDEIPDRYIMRAP